MCHPPRHARGSGTPALPGLNDSAWKDLGFTLSTSDFITSVDVGVEWFRTTAVPILNVTVSWDGGLSWATNQTATNKSADDDTLEFLDFTSATAWTATKLNDANLRVRVGTNASGPRLDYVTVRVTSIVELTFSEQMTGADYRVVLTYQDTADPTTASLSEWSVTEGRATYDASASGLTALLSGPTFIGYEFRLALKFGFQVKHAVAPTNSTVGAYNDLDSWNGEVVATDGPHTITLQEASTGEHMEFGVFMYTFVNISADWTVTVSTGRPPTRTPSPSTGGPTTTSPANLVRDRPYQGRRHDPHHQRSDPRGRGSHRQHHGRHSICGTRRSQRHFHL